MKIALFQYDIKWEDKKANKSKILRILEKEKRTFDYLIFPEMTLTGFSMNEQKTIIDKEDLTFFKNIAKNRKINLTFGGVLNKKNLAITLNKEGEKIDSYSKIHLFSKGKEDLSYKGGNKETSFKIKNMNIAVRICYDLRFSYLFWERAKDTELFIIIASWPESRKNHWLTLLSARAIENQAYVIGVNRIGSDPICNYSGDSVVFDPFGNKLLDIKNKEGIDIVDLDVNEIKKIRKTFNFLKDRLK